MELLHQVKEGTTEIVKTPFHAATAAALEFDVVIKGGRVMDPQTGVDAVRNVGINGDKIAIVTQLPLRGKEVIDATDLVVAPGFIDMHNHNAGAPFGQKLALRDGVTTPMELEAGVSPVGEWYDKLEGKCRTNYGASVGSIPCRERYFNPDYKTLFHGDFLYDMQFPDKAHTTMKWSTAVAPDEGIDKIVDLMKEGLDEGAIGIGHWYVVSVVFTEISCLSWMLIFSPFVTFHQPWLYG